MCLTKMLLKLFADSNNTFLFIILLKKQLMDPLGVIVPASISKKSLFGIITNKKRTRLYGATFWTLPMKFVMSEP